MPCLVKLERQKSPFCLAIGSIPGHWAKKNGLAIILAVWLVMVIAIPMVGNRGQAREITFGVLRVLRGYFISTGIHEVKLDLKKNNRYNASSLI